MEDGRPISETERLLTLVNKFCEGRHNYVERNLLIAEIIKADLFETFRDFDTRSLERFYSTVTRFGLEVLRPEAYDRLSEAIMYELQKRETNRLFVLQQSENLNAREENARSESSMRWLTWVAIGVTFFQAFLQTWDFMKDHFFPSMPASRPAQHESPTAPPKGSGPAETGV